MGECLNGIPCFPLENMSYGITCLTGAHVLHEVMPYRRICLMGVHVLRKNI